MPKSLLAFDTDHIKGYVFGTSKLKEIRGASSILDFLNRQLMVNKAKQSGAETIYANGGSALFLIDTDKAESLGKEIQNLYRERTGAGASITYAIQPIPEALAQAPDIKAVEMPEVLELLRYRLRMAKDGQPANGPQRQSGVKDAIMQPSHPFLCTCTSCGVAYAEDTWLDNEDPDEPEGRYCRVCLIKRAEDTFVKNKLRDTQQAALSETTLWGRILQSLKKHNYDLSARPRRPKDFNAFRDFTHGKEYLGLIYADANSMGKALEEQTSLKKLQNFARVVDDAVFNAMGYAIRQHLPVQRVGKEHLFPFDVLLIGGDDIVMVTPADKALQVAATLTEQFHQATERQYTLSVSVVLAPVKYPFNLQSTLAEDALKDAKKSGSVSNVSSKSKLEQSRVNFIVVTGNTSLSYKRVYQEMHREPNTFLDEQDEFYATMRPYTLSELLWLLEQLKKGNNQHIGRTKLHQMREAILKLNKTTTILESLALLRNWKDSERTFVKGMIEHLELLHKRKTKKQQDKGMLFPWYLDANNSSDDLTVYRTPLLDFIELYDFVSS